MEPLIKPYRIVGFTCCIMNETSTVVIKENLFGTQSSIQKRLMFGYGDGLRYWYLSAYLDENLDGDGVCGFTTQTFSDTKNFGRTDTQTSFTIVDFQSIKITAYVGKAENIIRLTAVDVSGDIQFGSIQGSDKYILSCHNAWWGDQIQPIPFSIYFQLDSSLNIISAVWGKTTVTDKVMMKINAPSLTISASETELGPSKVESANLILFYQYGNGIPQIAACKQGETIKITYVHNKDQVPKNVGQLYILGATYGLANVTEIVRSKVQENSIQDLIANDVTFNESISSTNKILVVVYQYGGSSPQTLTVKEGKCASIIPDFPRTTSLMEINNYLRDGQSFTLETGKYYLYVTSQGQVRLSADKKKQTFFKRETYAEGKYLLTIDKERSPESAEGRLFSENTKSMPSQLSVTNSTNVKDASIFSFYYMKDRGFILTLKHWDISTTAAYLIDRSDQQDTDGIPLQFGNLEDAGCATAFSLDIPSEVLLGEHILEKRDLMDPLDLARAKLFYKCTFGFLIATGSLPTTLFNTDNLEPGVLAVLRKISSTKGIVEKFDNLVDVAMKNKGATAIAASLSGIALGVYNEGLLWDILKLAINMVGPTFIAFAVGKILTCLGLPSTIPMMIASFLASFGSYLIDLVKTVLEYSDLQRKAIRD